MLKKIKNRFGPSGDENKFRLGALPDVPLRKIASFLPFEDAVQLSNMNPAWAHLQPTWQDIKGEDFKISGPRDGHFAPEIYFDIPIETAGLSTVIMSWEWQDQGWGNRKGQIWLQLIRGVSVIADCREAYYELAPHQLGSRDLRIVDHDVIRKARKGDILRVMRNAGGGGGHRLISKNFKIKIVHKRSN